MDFESLKSQVSNLTLYDLKAGVRKVQNAVMNLTEMESKVREATNADPWGAPSSLMMEIAQGTHNYQQLNEIMPLIYKRFTDKTAEEWRQIYKALQLLEFLVKNGSERVVDDARSHLSLLRMLRQFHYIDPNGKDQGINVRNRSQELSKLLGDVEAIRAERKKARGNRNKYGGVEGGSGLGFGPSGERYGGFGSETGGAGSSGYGAYSGEVYGDGGGFGGQDPDFRFQGTQKRGDQFEEYDEGEAGPAPSRATRTATTAATTKPAPPKAKEPEQDLFDFGEEPAVIPTTGGKAPVTANNGLSNFGTTQASTTADDDEFDDFQSATSPGVAPPHQANRNPLAALSSPPTTSSTASAPQFAAPKPVAASHSASISNLVSSPSPAPSATSSFATAPSLASPPLQQAKPLQPAGGYAPSGPNYYTSVRADINATPSGTSSAFPARPGMTATQPSYTSSTSAASLGKPAAKAGGNTASGGDAFASLWSSAGSKAGVQQKAAPSRGPGLADMAKQKSAAGIWGAASTPGAAQPAASRSTTQTTAQAKPAAPLGNGLDDLLG